MEYFGERIALLPIRRSGFLSPTPVPDHGRSIWAVSPHGGLSLD